MTELTLDVPSTAVMVVGGIVLLSIGDPFGRDLITLGVGIHVGAAEK
jgi:hypothetical protein